MALQDVIAKIQKLRNLAGNNPSLEEATTAAALADKLIAEYRLSEADISSDISIDADPIQEDVEYLYQSGKITTWKKELSMALTTHYGCAIWNDCSWATGRQVSRYRLVGKKSDVEIVKYMFAWLTVEIQRLSDGECKGKGRVFCGSYCLGAARGVEEQLRRNKAAQVTQAQTDGKSTALAKLDERGKESYAALHNIHKNLRAKPVYNSARINGEAYNAGKARGNNMGLNNGSSTKFLK